MALAQAGHKVRPSHLDASAGYYKGIVGGGARKIFHFWKSGEMSEHTEVPISAIVDDEGKPIQWKVVVS